MGRLVLSSRKASSRPARIATQCLSAHFLICSVSLRNRNDGLLTIILPGCVKLDRMPGQLMVGPLPC